MACEQSSPSSARSPPQQSRSNCRAGRGFFAACACKRLARQAVHYSGSHACTHRRPGTQHRHAARRQICPFASRAGSASHRGGARTRPPGTDRRSEAAGRSLAGDSGKGRSPGSRQLQQVLFPPDGLAAAYGYRIPNQYATTRTATGRTNMKLIRGIFSATLSIASAFQPHSPSPHPPQPRQSRRCNSSRP